MDVEKMNPFGVSKYTDPKDFCDRDQEVLDLIASAENQRPLMMSSMRRIGKTGLIHHFHHHLRIKGWITVYIDAFDTNSDDDLANRMISKLLQAIDSNKNKFIQNAINLFYDLSPKFSTDALTGMPTLELGFRKSEEISQSLETIFNVISKGKKKVQVAIDEFQQIANYIRPSRMDAILRKFIQQIDNIHFLFCGSQRHILADLFTNPKKPMYSMVQYLTLDYIEYPAYFDFIQSKFYEYKRDISDIVIHSILKWTRHHTYYTQFVCNRLFSMGTKKISEKHFVQIKQDIFKEIEFIYLNYTKILSKNQMKVLRALCIEGELKSVRSLDFTRTYNISGSTAQQSLDFLVNAELAYEILSHKKNSYIVYDVFLWRFIEYLESKR